MAEEKKEYVPIYYGSPEEAYRESVTSPEADAFRKSFKATEDCVADIEAAFKDNRSENGGLADKTFIDGLMDKHGPEMTKYVLASYIMARKNESKAFSDEAYEWAKGIRISDSYIVANAIILKGGDDLVNDLAMEVIKRTSGKDAVSTENPATDEDKKNPVEDDSEDETFTDVNGTVRKYKDGSIVVKMPNSAVIRKYATTAVICLPRNRGYDMYRYYADMKNLTENGDGTVSIKLCDKDDHMLTVRRRGEDVKLTAGDVEKIYVNAKDEDFVPAKFTITAPSSAAQGNYPNMVRLRYPDDSKYAKQHVVIPAIFKDEEKSDDEKYVFNVPDYMNFSVRNEDGSDALIPVSEVAKEINEGTYKNRVAWTHVNLPQEALLHRYETRSLLKMPDGEYKDYIYYLPNGMCPTDEKTGKINVRVPSDRSLLIKNGHTDAGVELTAKKWSELVWDKQKDAYSPTPKTKKKTDEDLMSK